MQGECSRRAQPAAPDVPAVRAWLCDCRCPECKEGDIDFSNPSFLQLTGLRPDRVKIEWSFTPCAPYINGSIRVRAVHAHSWHGACLSAWGGRRPL